MIYSAFIVFRRCEFDRISGGW